MKFLTQILIALVCLPSIASSDYPIYENVKLIKEYDIDLNEHSIFLECPFAKPEIDFNRSELQDRKIKKITYLFSYNNNYPGYAQSSLSDKRYRNLLKELKGYDLSNVQWETKAQAGLGDIEYSESLHHGFIIEFEAPENLLGHHNLDKQSFIIDNDYDTTVCGKDGTELLIPARAFVDPLGNNVAGIVKLELIEAVELKDIVIGGLYTTTDDQKVLESKGMINIQVFKNDSQLELNGDSEITVQLPTTFEDGYQFFEGTTSKGQLVWTNPTSMENDKEVVDENGNVVSFLKDGEHKGDFDMVTSKEMMDFFPLKVKYQKGHLESVLIMNYGRTVLATPGKLNSTFFKAHNINGDDFATVMRWFEQDTVIHDKVQWTVKNNKLINDDGNNPYNEGSLTNNIFKMRKTGWANCDKYSGVKESKMLASYAEFDDYDEFLGCQVSIVVPSNKVLLPGKTRKDGHYTFAKLPEGKKAIIIATGNKNGKNFLTIKKVKIGENKIEVLEVEEVETEESLKLIKKAI